MHANTPLQRSRQSWQISFADLLALLLCFIVLQFAMQSPLVKSTPAQKNIVKRSTKESLTWFQSRIDKRISVSLRGVDAILLKGQLQFLEGSMLGIFGCSVSIISKYDNDIEAALRLQQNIKQVSPALLVRAGYDSRAQGLTVDIDLGECK
jgi:hypothetical protein